MQQTPLVSQMAFTLASNAFDAFVSSSHIPARVRGDKNSSPIYKKNVYG